VLDRPIRIVGAGPVQQIVIESRSSSCFVLKADATLRGLTLRCVAGQTGASYFGAEILQGRPRIENCWITSDSLSCLLVIGQNSGPVIQNSTLHESKQCGILFAESAARRLENCDIYRNTWAGIGITKWANPTVIASRIHDGKQAGMIVFTSGLGQLENCDVYGNALAGIEIKEGANPTVIASRIYDGKQGGVLVHASGLGRLENCDIYGNTMPGIMISEGADPTLRRNRISKNGYEAIWVHNGGCGVFEDNDLRGNAKGAWDVSPDCQGKVQRAQSGVGYFDRPRATVVEAKLAAAEARMAAAG
jgi:parallel beta-helix repeat protein